MAVLSANAKRLLDPLRYRWTRDDYQRLAETGFFPGDTALELIQGDLLVREPPGPFHAASVNPVADILKAAFGEGFTVRTEQPLITGGESTPQPDVAVCVGSRSDFRKRHPGATETRLVVEIADSTLEKDREVKSVDYASAEIPEYWIVNLRDNRLEVYRDPRDGDYLSERKYFPGDTVTPLHASNAIVSVADLLDA